METKVSAIADFGNRISIKWSADTFLFIRREAVTFVLSRFIDNRFATSHLFTCLMFPEKSLDANLNPLLLRLVVYGHKLILDHAGNRTGETDHLYSM